MRHIIRADRGAGVVAEMDDSQHSDGAFTLVELMVVVLIIGILLSIAIPIYESEATTARAKSCQANQRTILGAIDIARSADVSFASASNGVLTPLGSGWYGILIPGWIKSEPRCQSGDQAYYITTAGDVTGDSGTVESFKTEHELQ